MSDTPLDDAALTQVPIFPLPKLVLLPGHLLSLHIFEPRYRKMVTDLLEGPKLLVLAMAKEGGEPDSFGRPPIHPVAGIGLLRRSAKLPDGRYNIVLEGIGRVDISAENPPDYPGRPYRRAHAKLLQDDLPEDLHDLKIALSGMLALAARVLSPEALESTREIEDPSRVTDLIAAAALTTPAEHQRALETLDVPQRVQLVTGALGALVLQQAPPEDEDFGWGVRPGKA